MYNRAGKRVDADKSVLKENKLEISHRQLENGTYTVKWEIVSNDGHPTEGSLSFQIEMEPQKKEITKNEKQIGRKEGRCN